MEISEDRVGIELHAAAAQGLASLALTAERGLFIEWTAADAEVNTPAELAELQVQLAWWQRNWERI